MVPRATRQVTFSRRVVIPLALFAVCLGCSAESVGSSAAALGTSYSGSTQTGGGRDDTLITVDTSFAPPGSGGSGTPGVCWFTQVLGSFRGKGEFAKIGTNSSTGNYQLQLHSNTSYDHATGVGPEATITCASLTDLGITSAQVSDFSASFINSGKATPTNFGGPTTSTTTATDSDWAPWSGIDGRLRNQFDYSYVIDNNITTVYAKENSCDVSANECQVTSYAWDISGTTEAFAYDLSTSATTNGSFADVQLESASNTICWIDGIGGAWGQLSDAEIDQEADGYWHLYVNYVLSLGAVTGYARCMSAPHSY